MKAIKLTAAAVKASRGGATSPKRPFEMKKVVAFVSDPPKSSKR